MSLEHKNEYEEPSINELLLPYKRKWFWFVIGIFIAIISSFIYLRYTTPKFETKATVLIKDKADNGFSTDLDPFRNLGIFKRFSKGKLENDLAIIESRRILSKTIEELEFNIKYEVEGRVIKNELYPNSPIHITYLNINDSIQDNISIPQLYVNVISDSEFELRNESVEYGTYNFGEKFTIGEISAIITPTKIKNDGIESLVGNTYIITYTNTTDLAIYYQEAIEIVNDIENSNVITISMQSPVTAKNEDFINELVRQYNLDAAEDQDQIAHKTAEFIDSRIEIIIKDLDSVETDKEQFKVKNQLTSIEVESQMVLAGATEYNSKQVEYYTQIDIINSVIDYLEKDNANQSVKLLPSNLGIKEGELATSIANYNQLVLEHNRLLNLSTIQNPIVVNIKDQITKLRANLIESLYNHRNALNVALREISQQESRFNSRLSQVPSQEKYFRDIVRQQQIKEELYIFLLKQREEASIKLATTTQKAKVIDSAFSTKNPISPKKGTIFLGASLIGLLLPFMFIYLKDILNTKIENRKDVEKELKGLSLIGEIPKIKGDANQIIQVNDRSVLAESFRILRTNLQYFFVNKISNEESKSIFVSSTIKGEGKTLVAFNLALTLSYTGKKVALVGADIRNPQLQRYIPKKMRKHQGLTEYIMRHDLGIKEVIVPTEFKNLDVVLSGVIPPNPAELLLQDRVNQFFDELKSSYDYVIVDTAPTMLVTDTLLISKYSDVILYVIKANYTDKKLLEFPKDAIEDGRLSNVALVLNGVTMNNFGYGNKYGYAYSKEKPSLKERLFG